MPAAPNLPTTVTTNTTGHLSHSEVVHGVVNSIYLAAIGATRTVAFTLAQSMSGEFIPVNVASSVAVTVPTLAVGTSIELWAQGAGKFTLTASGVTLSTASGSSTTPRVQGSSVTLLWVTATLVYVSGDLA